MKWVFEWLRANLEEIVTVSENQILEAINLCQKNFDVDAEGAGVVGLAGLLDFTIRKNKLRNRTLQ